MFVRYGNFIARHARTALVLSAAALVVATTFGVGAFRHLKSGGFDDPGAQASRAAAVIDTKFGSRPDLVLLVQSKIGTVDAPTVRAAGQTLVSSLAAQPGVTGVISYWNNGAPSLRSTDGRYALIAATLSGDEAQVRQHTRTLLSRYVGNQAAIDVRAGGNDAVSVDVNSAVTRSLAIAESVALPLTLLLLVLAFGSVVAAALPLAVGAVAILGTFAELFLLGAVIDVSVFAINLTTALGLALGVDYALLLVSRFREELAGGSPVREAVSVTVATAGRTIVFASGTVIAALAALLVFPLYFLRSFAYAGIGVVAIAATAALVVIPALLALLGHRVNAGRLPWARSVRGAASGRWGAIAAAVMRRPALTAVPVLAALLFAASPLLHVSFGTPDQGVLPSGASSRQVADILATDFPSNSTGAIDVIIDAPVPTDALASYAKTLSNLPGVSTVDSSVGTFADGRPGPTNAASESLGRPDAQRLIVSTRLASKSGPAQALVTAIRAIPGPPNTHPLIGGENARLVDTKHSIAQRLPYALMLIGLTTFVLLFLFTGSVIQPVRALLLNALSLSATLGVLTWIFQDGHLSTLLGFTERPMDTAMTVLLFCITFGLSMDYELIVTSRVKELHDAGADTADAVVHGLSRTGRIVTTAAVLLAVGFFAFGTASVSFLQMFGLGSGLAILIDATLVRGVLVPVVMHLVDQRIWWAPAPLRRMHARVALSET